VPIIFQYKLSFTISLRLSSNSGNFVCASELKGANRSVSECFQPDLLRKLELWGESERGPDQLVIELIWHQSKRCDQAENGVRTSAKQDEGEFRWRNRSQT